jgi:p21-activated kinase 1
MSTPSAIKPRPSSTRHSRITVEYHRPSRESIQEYGALLDQANLHAHASSNSLPAFTPSRQAPPPPPSGPSSFKPKDPLSPTTTMPVKTRNSLQKPPPRNRKPSIQTNTLRTNHATDASVLNNTDLSPIKSSFSHSNGSSPNVTSPPRPSRTNTTNLAELFQAQTNIIAQRRVSTPVIGSTYDFLSAADPASHTEDEDPPSSHPVLNPIMNSPSTSHLPSSFTTNGTGTTRARSATVTKGKKGMLGFVSDLLGSNKRMEISTPYDPVHLTHVGFNTSTGEFTGLPKEWQQLLQESGISRTEQEKNPEAVMEIVKFYQEGGGGDVWDKMSSALKSGPPILPAPPPSRPLMDESFYAPVCLFDSIIPAFNAHSKQRPAPGLPKRQQHPTPVTQSNSTTTQSITPSPSRTAPTPPSNRPGLDRSVSVRTQTKNNSPGMSRSNTTKETRSTSDRHTPHNQQSPTHQSAQQQQTLPTPTKSKVNPNVQPPSNNSSTDLKAHQKSKQTTHQAHNKPGTGLNPPGAAPRRREKKDKDDDFDIVKRLQQICTAADPTRLYRNLVKIGAG